MQKSHPIVFITGATSGIGLATAEVFAQHQYPLILVGRRAERLKEIADNLSKQTQIHTLTLDVREAELVKTACDSLPSEWQNIGILINNAGLAVGLSSVQEGVLEDWERMIDTNVKGLLYVTRAIAPKMIQRGEGGHIFNVSSIAGKEVYPNGNVYCATKHAVDALSKSMRMDLLPHQIKVTNIAPGMVETEFSVVRFKGDSDKADSVYKGLQPLTGEDIANVIFYAATLPAHVCLNDIVIMPTAQASAAVVKRG